MASSYSQDEVRQCVRSLVGIIRSASQQSSPVDDAQLAHIRKVVKLLSLCSEVSSWSGGAGSVIISQSPRDRHLRELVGSTRWTRGER